MALTDQRRSPAPLLTPLLALLFWFVLCGALAAQERTEPGLLLAEVYEGQVDLEQYWVSEKFDGVRAYWDGHQLTSRQGNVFKAPSWFIAGFPGEPLDGELWMGRGQFAAVSGAVRQHQPDDKLWRQIRYKVFDLPAHGGTFDARLRRLRQLIDSLSTPYIQAVRQYKVGSAGELDRKLREVVAGGGEGLMLHRGDSRYRAGRSDDLLKVKTYQDAEARVLAHLPGKGQFEGMLGSLLVETGTGQRFRIGTGFSHAQRRQPPPVGSTITFKYTGLTRTGLPRFASFLRVRQLPD